MCRGDSDVRQSARFLFGLALFCVMGSSAAETVYVTDSLLLGLYEEPDSKGRQLQTLSSGTELTVLERNQYYAKVRTVDGTEGWTKTAYLVSEKPPRMRLTELEAQNQHLSKQLEAAREAVESSKLALTELQTQATAASDSISQGRQALEALQNENRQLQERSAAYQNSIPLSWALGAIAGSLIFGFAGGFAWLDHRIRKRHGGFRIR
jgi:SH3 domain protein